MVGKKTKHVRTGVKCKSTGEHEIRWPHAQTFIKKTPTLLWSYRLPHKKYFHFLYHVYIVNILYEGAYRGVPVDIHVSSLKGPCVTYLRYSPVISCVCHPSMCSSSRDKNARHEPYVMGRGEESLLWYPGSDLRLLIGGRERNKIRTRT